MSDELASSTPSFSETVSLNHYELSAASFARFTYNNDDLISIFNIIENDPFASQSLQFLHHLNLTIRDMEREVFIQKHTAARLFRDFIDRPSTATIPPFIHRKLSPNCRTCRLRSRQPTPYSRRQFSMDDPSSPSTSSSSPDPPSPRQRSTSTTQARRSYIRANRSTFSDHPRLGLGSRYSPIVIEDSDDE